jgi:hypothetical protein
MHARQRKRALHERLKTQYALPNAIPSNTAQPEPTQCAMARVIACQRELFTQRDCFATATASVSELSHNHLK